MNRWTTCPIQIACAKDNSTAIKFLLRKDAKINVDIESGRRRGYIGGVKHIFGLHGYAYGDNLLLFAFALKLLSAYYFAYLSTSHRW